MVQKFINFQQRYPILTYVIFCLLLFHKFKHQLNINIKLKVP